MANAYLLIAYQVSFESVFNSRDEELVKMFKALEASGLRVFLGAPATIFKGLLTVFYGSATATDGRVVFSSGGKTLVIDQEMLSASFSLPSEGITDFSSISADAMSRALRSFSSTGEEISPSCFKKLMKMEFQVLADIVAKSLLTKAGTFDKLTKEKVRVMTAIMTGVKINWSAVIFKNLFEMAANRTSTGFAPQLSLLLKRAGFRGTDEADGSGVTLLDAEIIQMTKQRQVSSSSVQTSPRVQKQ